MGFLGELRERGSAILLITHDFKLAHFCADRVSILRAGRITAQGVFARSEGRASDGAAP